MAKPDAIEVFKAYNRIKRYIVNTPTMYSEIYSEYVDGHVYLKLENMQITGSFKLRGVLNKIIKNRLSNTTVVSASAGNHGKALAYAANLFNLEAHIFIPSNAPKNKREAIKRFGAKVIEVAGDYDEAEKAAKKYAEEKGLTYISPYNDIDIIYGQGTVGLEISRDAPEIDIIIVPVGGGGLISGISIILKSIDPDIEIIGVQSSASPSIYESIKSGKIVEVELKESIADGLHGNIEKDSITFEIIRDMVDEIILVDEDDIEKAIINLIKTHQIIVEGAAATSLATLMKYRDRFRDKSTCIILTGRNIDYELLHKLMSKYS